jgi:hypothetical protein
MGSIARRQGGYHPIESGTFSPATEPEDAGSSTTRRDHGFRGVVLEPATLAVDRA